MNVSINLFKILKCIILNNYHHLHYQVTSNNKKGYIKINFIYYVVKGLALTIGLNFV